AWTSRFSSGSSVAFSWVVASGVSGSGSGRGGTSTRTNSRLRNITARGDGRQGSEGELTRPPYAPPVRITLLIIVPQACRTARPGTFPFQTRRYGCGGIHGE